MRPGQGVPMERLGAAWTAFLTVGLLLGLRLFYVQVLQHETYTRAAERNRTQVLRRTAPRGRILDRQGEIVASNQAVFSLIFMPSKDQDPAALAGLARDLAPHLKTPPQDLLKALSRATRERSPVRLAEKLPSRVMFKLSELRTLYPGVSLVDEFRRHYPRGPFAAHLLGYMGKMDESGWRRLKGKGYQVDSWIGKTGLEALFERELRGVDGGIRMEIDARGRLKRVLEEFGGAPGADVRLTLDARLQQAAEDALRRSPSRSGAVVVLDPSNGAVLALTSIPDYDPNRFLDPGPEGTDALREIPEFNLAVQGTYPPGSIFKIVSAAAILDAAGISPLETTYCPGYFELGRRVMLCWEKKGHRTQSFIGGLAHSCDVYFYRMGIKAGGEAIERTARMFRLGDSTKVGLASEAKGRVFGPRARLARGLSWYDGDTANLAIGQGEMLVTPMQMAVLMAAVANRGTLWRPHFIDRVERADGEVLYRHGPEVLGVVKLRDSTWELLHHGLTAVLKEGTARSVALPGLEIAGKTGTAQTPLGEDHAWFVAYAGRPGEKPSIALAVLGFHGGHGSEAAGPVAKKILSVAFGLEEKRAAVLGAEPAAPLAPAPRGAGLPLRIH